MLTGREYKAHCARCRLFTATHPRTSYFPPQLQARLSTFIIALRHFLSLPIPKSITMRFAFVALLVAASTASAASLQARQDSYPCKHSRPFISDLNSVCLLL